MSSKLLIEVAVLG